jgi:methionyl-tRNA formyltransferase
MRRRLPAVCGPSDVTATEPAALPTGPVRRVAFLGTPDVGVIVLDALIEARVDVAHVVTRVDKRRGRGSTLVPSPVKAAALAHGVPVSHRVDDLLEISPPIDLGVVVAYGAIVKPHVLAAIPMVNLHFSLLPRWRGAAPIERCLLAGDSRTGVCLMQVDEGLDTGGVLAVESIDVDERITADELRVELARRGSRLLVDALRDGLPPAVPQAGDPVYAEKLSNDDRHIVWSESAETTARRSRIGGAWSALDGARVRIGSLRVTDEPSRAEPGTGTVVDGRLLVATGDRDVEILTLQPEGKSMMSARDWANGRRGAPVRFST